MSKVLIGISAGVVVITSIILIAVSFGTLEPTEWGLVVNGNFQELDTSQVYKGGRYFLGLGSYFIKFPNTVIGNELAGDDSVEGRSSDGLTIDINVSFEYRLREGDLVKLYYKFSTNFNRFITMIARNTVRNVIGKFEAFSFFIDRNVVSEAMRVAMLESLSEVHCDLYSFQLLNIKLPSKFDQAIQQTEVTRQNIDKALFESTKAEIEAETLVIAAEQQAAIINSQARGVAQSTLLKAEAEARVIEERINSLRDAYLSVKQNYTMDTQELLTWIWLTSIQDTKAPITYNVKKPDGMSF